MLYLSLHCEKNENKQTMAGVGPFLKNSFIYYQVYGFHVLEIDSKLQDQIGSWKAWKPPSGPKPKTDY